MQIDWVTGYTSPGELYRMALEGAGERLWDFGRWTETSSDGEILREHSRRELVRGSHDSTCVVGSRDGLSLSLDGNPVKFLQGHNLFGSPDALGMFVSMGSRVRRLVGCFPSPSTWEGLAMQFPIFTRVDVTRSYRFSSEREALRWIRWVAGTAHVSRLKKGLKGGSTVMFGTGSRRWNFKIYAKFSELRSGKRGHGLPASILPKDRRRLEEWAEGVVRFELLVRGLELKRLDPAYRLLRSDADLYALWKLYFDRIQFNRNAEAEMDDLTLDLLTAQERQVFELWRRGVDLEDLGIARATWYRRRRSILDKVGVDISEGPPADALSDSEVSELDPVGWDPEPLEDLMHDPSEVVRQYRLKVG